MRIIDMGSQRGPFQIIETATAVECGPQIRYRRSFRSLVECVVPCCGFPIPSSSKSESISSNTTELNHGSVVTGTFFGYRKGRVSFCLQDDSKTYPPLLLVEFAVPTAYLAKEMQFGLLRIALESDRRSCSSNSSTSALEPLFGMPVWSMYCNGRKVGYAVRRQMTESDLVVFKLMQSVSVGAGVLPVAEPKTDDGELMYLRASFQRVVGSVDSESFHMINPAGCSGQELSIFLLRS